MRATRNASKVTPPPPKRGGKGTPGKGTPKSEKEDSSKVEAAPATASETEASHSQSSASADIKPVDALALDENQEEKPEVAEKIKTLKDATDKEDAQDSEREPDKLKDSALDAPKATVEATETVPDQVDDLDGSKSLVHVVIEEEASEADTEMLEENNKDQIEGAGTDDVRSEEGEEEDDDKDEDEDDGEEGNNELDDERPARKNQKSKKLEVFVGGLHKEATMDDVKRIFETVGDVQEVRMNTHLESGKNKGYAFVRFATAEQAIRAASELDRTKIRDKECAVVPSEENDTLFVGNICKSWSSEQVTEKLKEYGVEGFHEMVLVEDNENEGNNRGHAFLEFVSHSDAVKAFKCLKKPDAIFGCNRSAKVAWAEGSSKADETAMTKVKSIFVSGLPAEWDNEKISEHFGKYGDIERVLLAKNIAKSKRTDFAFVNFATRDAAVAAIEALNDAELTDGDKKVKLKVELAKPTSRKKRMKGHRGSYPVGGGPSKQRKEDDGQGDHGRLDKRRGKGSRGFFEDGHEPRGGSAKNFRGTKRKENRPLPAERSRDRHNRRFRTPRAGAAVPDDDESYMPLGARILPGYTPSRGYTGRSSREVAYPQRAPSRGYTGRSSREVAYPLRAERGAPYSGVGSKRTYSAVDEEAAYYESGVRGYPRARVEYGEPTLFSEPLRATTLGHGSLGHALPGGGHGYPSVLPGEADYAGSIPGGAVDLRGSAYPPYYAGRRGSGYSGSGRYY